MSSRFDICLLLYVIRLAGWLKHCNLSLSLFPTGIPLQGSSRGMSGEPRWYCVDEMWAWGNQQEQANTRGVHGEDSSRRSVRKGSGAMEIPSLHCDCLGELQGMSRKVKGALQWRNRTDSFPCGEMATISLQKGDCDVAGLNFTRFSQTPWTKVFSQNRFCHH